MAPEVRFTPSLEDFLEARRDIYRQYFHSRRGRAGYLIVVLLMTAVGIAQALLEDPDSLFENIVAFGILGLVTSGVLIAITWLLLPTRSRRLFEQSKTLHQEFRYVWSDAGLRYASATGSGEVPWPMLYGWYRGRTNLLFYFNQGLCHFIPLRTLDEAQVPDLIESVAFRAEAPVTALWPWPLRPTRPQ